MLAEPLRSASRVTSSLEPVRFVAIYRWRIAPGKESAFRGAWAQMTRAIREQRGGLGSRLHRTQDGVFVAYAQWPSREAWEHSRAQASCDPAASQQMGDCIESSLETTLLDVEHDLLECNDQRA